MRILLVTDKPPWPPIDGARQRTALLLRALKECGETDTFALFDPARDGIEDWPDLRRRMHCIEQIVSLRRGQLGPWAWVRPLWPSLVDRLAHNFGSLTAEYEPDPLVAPALDRCLATGRYDIVVGRYLRPTAYAGALRHAPVVLDVDDLDTQTARSRLAVPGQPAWKRFFIRNQLRQLERIVPAALAGVNHLWVATETDRAEIGHDRVTVLPNIPYAEAYPEHPGLPASEDPSSAIVLMIASMSHRVNVEGVERFLTECWPEIRRQHSAATFKIAGAAMTKEQATRWSSVPGVQALGFVENLAPLYAEAAIAVVPLFEGGGTKIKVLEALRHGRVAAVTAHAHRGYEHVLPPENTVAVAIDAPTLVRDVVRLLKNPAERRARATEGWRQVHARFSWPAFRDVVKQGIAAAVSRNPETQLP